MVVGVGTDVPCQLGRRHPHRKHARLVRDALLTHQLRPPRNNLERIIDAEDVCNDWSSDMQRLLGLVEKTWMGMNAALAAQSRVKA